MRILKKPELKFYTGDVPYTWTLPSMFPIRAQMTMVGRHRKMILTPNPTHLSETDRQFVKDRVMPDLCLFAKIYEGRKRHLRIKQLAEQQRKALA